MSAQPVQVCVNYEARMSRLARTAGCDGRVSMQLVPIVLRSKRRIDLDRLHALAADLVRAFHLFQLTFRVTKTGTYVHEGESPCSIRLCDDPTVTVNLRNGFHASDLMRLQVRNSRWSGTAILWLDHLLADGVAAAILGTWLARRYNGADSGYVEKSRYVDFARSQREYLASEAGLAAVHRRWSQLEPYGLAPPCPLAALGTRSSAGEPACRVRTSVFLAQERGLGIPEAVCPGLTPYMLMLAATLLAMRKHGSSQHPAVVGITAGRFMSGYANTAGWLANLTVLGAYLSDCMSFADVAREARFSVVNAIVNEKVPYHELVRRRNPTMFGVFPATPWIFLADASAVVPPSHVAGGDMVMCEDLTGLRRRVHNMVVSIRPFPGRLEFIVEYPPSLYRRRDVATFAQSISDAARLLMTDPARRIAQWLG